MSNELDNKKAQIIDGIIKQREEILRAFVAKYRLQPDEAEQVIGMSSNKNEYVWYVRKREVII